MNLYTIAGRYPDKNFNWTLNPDMFGTSALQHVHVIGDIAGLLTALNNKAVDGHTHTTYLTGLKIGNQAVTGDVVLQGIGVDASTPGDIELSIDLPATGDVVGVKNVNTVRRHTAVRYATTETPVLDDALVLAFIPETNR